MKPITAIKNYVVATILLLAVNNGDTLWARTDHPFFINGKYVAAQELNPGDQFSTYDGSNLFLKEKLSKDTSIQVYNLTVADNANYYVGRNPVLVHSSCFLNHLDNYPVLKAIVNDLDEGLKGEFIKDFFKAGDDVIDKLNKNSGMLRAWDIFKKSPDVRISTLATEISSLEKFTDIVKSNSLGLEESSLGALLNAKTKVKKLPWEHPEVVLDAVKRASNANIDAVQIKRFPTPSEGNTTFILNNAKQYQLEASGDALLSFEKGDRSFDNVTQDIVLIDRKYGHGSSVFNSDLSINNRARANSILDQALAQIASANGTPVRWEVSTELGANGIQKLFDDLGIDIEVRWVKQIKIIY